MDKCLAINKIDELNINVEKYIIGIKNYNYFNILEMDIENIESIINKNIIVSLNKLFKNSELDELLEVLKKLDGKVYGVIFDDPSLYNLVKDNNLNINLIWGNIHGVCSYNSINAWYDLGVKEAIVSPDITINDIIDIKKNTKSKLYVNIYGRVNISSSKRKFISNYFEYINKPKLNELYYIENKNNLYPIYEKNDETFILSDVINGLSLYTLLEESNIDNVIFNSYGIDNIEEIINNLSDSENIYTGFLYKNSIYRVGDIND